LRVLIIGAGVAGLAAAICARRAGCEATVIERRGTRDVSARDAHVHRLPPKSQAQLTQISSAVGQDGLGAAARFGAAQGGAIDWQGRQSLFRLGDLEASLQESAVANGVELAYGQNALALRTADDGWRLDVEAGWAFEADLLIDASGAHRTGIDLLGDRLPDIPLDDIDAPERHVSWRARTAANDPVLIAWSDQTVNGLLQVDADGCVQLTARTGLGERLTLERACEAAQTAGGVSLARRLAEMRFEPRGVQHTSPGVRRVALEEVDLGGLPPFALVGDALIEAPPRYGEGVGRAFDQALMLEGLLRKGQAAEYAATLAEQAKAHWAGYGVAMSLRPLASVR